MSAPQAVLITGCSSGIGRATALEAASRGHRVFATARDRAGLEELAGLSGIGALPLDVTDPESIRRAVEAAAARTGRIDALVNNAGYAQYGAVEDVSPEEWRRQFDVNLFGAIEVTRAVLPAMRQARGGTIVNVSSIAGKIAIPFSAPYSASKHALEAVSDALRRRGLAFWNPGRRHRGGPDQHALRGPGPRAGRPDADLARPLFGFLRQRRAGDGDGLQGGEPARRKRSPA